MENLEQYMAAFKAKDTVKDGQVFRVEPPDPSKYSDMVQRRS